MKSYVPALFFEGVGPLIRASVCDRFSSSSWGHLFHGKTRACAQLPRPFSRGGGDSDLFLAGDEREVVLGMRG